MSAWVVDTIHVDVLIRYGLARPSERLSWRVDNEWRQLTYENASDVGRLLMEENVASVCFRYEGDTADMYEDALSYEYTDPGYTMTAREALRAVSCLDYQSCEHPGWLESEARRILDAIEGRATSELSEGPWGWTSEDLAEKPRDYPIFKV